MGEADLYFLFRGENNTAGAVLDGFEVVLLQPKSWRTPECQVTGNDHVMLRAGLEGMDVSGVFPSCQNYEIQGNS